MGWYGYKSSVKEEERERSMGHFNSYTHVCMFLCVCVRNNISSWWFNKDDSLEAAWTKKAVLSIIAIA